LHAYFYSSNSFEDLSPEISSKYIDLEGTGMLLNELAKVAGKSAIAL